MRFISDNDREAYHKLREACFPIRSVRDLIGKCMPGCVFGKPVSKSGLARAEQQLGNPLPKKLKNVLLKTDGVTSSHGDEIIYSLQRIVSVNQQFRDPSFLAELSMPFDDLLFFSGVGDGDEFAFPILKNRSYGLEPVFIWSHESDCREEYAMGIEDYIIKYTIEIYRPRIAVA